MTFCPFPNCSEELTGRHAVICSEHYFQLGEKEARFLIRMKILASRTRDEQKRKHLESQLEGYIQSAIRRAISNRNIPVNKESNCVS